MPSVQVKITRGIVPPPFGVKSPQQSETALFLGDSRRPADFLSQYPNPRPTV